MTLSDAGSVAPPAGRRPLIFPDSTAVRTAVVAVLVMLAVRFAMGLQLDGLDDAGYLDAARLVSRGESLTDLFPLFRTRVGMAYPLGWLVGAGWIQPRQFWLLTTLAECVTVLALLVAGRNVTGAASAGVWAALMYAIYPLAVQQGMMFYPTAFQVASITAALALIAVAERLPLSSRIVVAFVGGACLGLGYLVKEDTALVVPALVLVTAILRFPSFATVLAVCSGAALVFLVESVCYWLSTGDPLFRLAATSGLGFAAQDDIQIGAIYRWTAYPRTLWLMPVQVGVMWWLLLPALWTAFRTRPRSAPSNGIRAVAVLFVVVFAYLQFGSGSFREYSPLPKSPRYTALVTPMLMLLVGAWLSQVENARPKVARWIAALVTITAVPCIMFLNASSSERARNTLSVVPALEQVGGARVYSDFYSIRLLRLLQPDSNFAVWFHARFNTKEFIFLAEPNESGAYVFIDQQLAKIYTSSYEMPLPEAVTEPPPTWKVVWTGRAYSDGSVTRIVLEFMRNLLDKFPAGTTLRARGTRYISDMIDNDRATLYRVP